MLDIYLDDFERLGRADIVLSMIKILFHKKFQVFFGFVYLASECIWFIHLNAGLSVSRELFVWFLFGKL